MTNSAALTSAEKLKRTAPRLSEITQDLLFGEIWERPGLSKRDRSLITVAALVTAYRPDPLRRHITRALENGVTREELVETCTHLAFYAGWPGATAAIDLVHDILDAA